MAEVYLASSAVPGFGGQETIEAAFTAGFDGVQLYLDPRYREIVYTDTTLRILALSRLGLIVHLPPELTNEDVAAARRIAIHRPGTKMLIHNGPATYTPEIPGSVVGWENSVTGKHAPDHIIETQHKSLRQGKPFVYDFGRSRQPGTDEEHARIIKFIKGMIASMRPGKDIIHAANQLSWDKSFRECESSLARGIWTCLVPDLVKWPGVVVLENENLEMAKEGLKVLRSA
jgi:hypothetical protein